jgi:hypothetical protein
MKIGNNNIDYIISVINGEPYIIKIKEDNISYYTDILYTSSKLAIYNISLENLKSDVELSPSNYCRVENILICANVKEFNLIKFISKLNLFKLCFESSKSFPKPIFEKLSSANIKRDNENEHEFLYFCNIDNKVIQIKFADMKEILDCLHKLISVFGEVKNA